MTYFGECLQACLYVRVFVSVRFWWVTSAHRHGAIKRQTLISQLPFHHKYPKITTFLQNGKDPFGCKFIVQLNRHHKWQRLQDVLQGNSKWNNMRLEFTHIRQSSFSSSEAQCAFCIHEYTVYCGFHGPAVPSVRPRVLFTPPGLSQVHQRVQSGLVKKLRGCPSGSFIILSSGLPDDVELPI